MSESVTKTLVGAVAIAVLFWVFWNPATESTKAKPKAEKTEQVSKKKKKKSRAKSLPKKLQDAKRRAARSGDKANRKRKSIKKLDPPEGSAAYVVTGNISAVRLRAEDGEMFGPGILPMGRYQILSRGKGGIKEHGHVVFEDGDRKRIQCDDEGCRPWKPKTK